MTLWVIKKTKKKKKQKIRNHIFYADYCCNLFKFFILDTVFEYIKRTKKKIRFLILCFHCLKFATFAIQKFIVDHIIFHSYFVATETILIFYFHLPKQFEQSI